MTTSPEAQLAEQEALAVTQALMEGRESDAFLMITGSDSPTRLALAGCGLAAAVLRHGRIDGARWLAERQMTIASEGSGPVF